MRKICFALAMTLTSVPMLSKVTLPSVYTDNMVLQQQSTLRIHGKAAPGSQVELQTSWSRMAQQVKADAMGWKWARPRRAARTPSPSRTAKN